MKNCVCTAMGLLALVSAYPFVANADLPEVAIIRPDAAIHPNEPATVVYRLSWAGDSDAWRIPAPGIEQPEWGQVLLQSATTYPEGDRTVAEFSLAVMARETGLYELSPIAFDVCATEDLVRNETAPLKEPPAEWTTADSVTSEPVTLSVVPDYTRWISIGVGLGVAAVAVLAGAWAMLRATRQSAATLDTVADDPREHVHAARKYRLDGDFYRFFLALGKAAGMATGPDAVKLAAQHNERAREVGYGAIRPTDDEMDAALKDTERLITATGG